MGAGALRSGAPQPTREEKVEVAAVLAPEMGDAPGWRKELGTFKKNGGSSTPCGLNHQNMALNIKDVVFTPKNGM